MSYRIAWVRFNKSGVTYPVNCHRRDLQTGDIVVVDMASQNDRKVAQVASVEFLNWNCVNTIVCKRSEWKCGIDGEYLVHRMHRPDEVPETLVELVAALKALGWREFESTSKVWRRVLAKAHPEISGTIALRARGIDFHAVNGRQIPGVSGRSITVSSAGEGRFVRNWYYHSGLDLFEHTLRFAHELRLPSACIDPYMRGIGSKQSVHSSKNSGDGLSAIRDAINGGMGGPAYLCDGIWI